MTLYQDQGLTILWRGSLASCNYGCPYCPFAKTDDDRKALNADRQALERFVDWAISRPYNISILFTPWGEALIRNYYREAMIKLSHAPNIPTVAIQTNLSCSIDWIEASHRPSIAFWITFHPGETPRESFLQKISQLDQMGIRHSVGIVGLKEHFQEIENLKKDLPAKTYLWVNAYKRVENYYNDEQLSKIVEIDPLFELNNNVYHSRGRACFAGEKVISVLADGTVRRCHFIEMPIGNIYNDDFENILKPRLCTQESCRCHIGYSHLKALNLSEVFGNGFLERRPEHPASKEMARTCIKNFQGI